MKKSKIFIFSNFVYMIARDTWDVPWPYSELQKCIFETQIGWNPHQISKFSGFSRKRSVSRIWLSRTTLTPTVIFARRSYTGRTFCRSTKTRRSLDLPGGVCRDFPEKRGDLPENRRKLERVFHGFFMGFFHKFTLIFRTTPPGLILASKLRRVDPNSAGQTQTPPGSQSWATAMWQWFYRSSRQSDSK